MVDVRIPAVFRTHVGGAKSVEAKPGSLKQIFDELIQKFPGLSDQLVSEDGSLHRFVNVYLNDEDVRYLQGVETDASDGDVVAILPAVAGG